MNDALKPYALLDDAQATVDQPSSRFYRDFRGEMFCTDPLELDNFWATVELRLHDGLHVLVLADYEWGLRLQGVNTRHGAPGRLRVLLFAECLRGSQSEVTRWLIELDGAADPAPAGFAQWQASIDAIGFERTIDDIHAAIRAGETYQVNFTYRLDAEFAGSPVGLYQRLRERQPAHFGALIALPDGEEITHVLSLSPELFLRHEAGRLTARPMKGTAARATDIASDLLAREQLTNAKNRAENLMIVDLLRNDLGRIARIGSVHVPALFEIEALPTVWQMTSTITAELLPHLKFPDILRAMFPCGSITGAPKQSTMRLIDQLESSARGIYCGAIGWFDLSVGNSDLACGDFCLSVPIRTMTLQWPVSGWRQLRLGIGAGIVADSLATLEHAECELKARFLTDMESDFGLIETMYSQFGEIRHLERHLSRLSSSAATLGIPLIETDIRQALLTLAATLNDGHAYRLRLLLQSWGGLQLEHGSLELLPAGKQKLLIAEQPINVDAWPLAHKSTVRGVYEQALQLARQRNVFDVLHFNQRGELTEGARSNVFLRLDGQWFTPALSCGVLPGVMRAVILDDPSWQASERVLTRDDLARAEAIMVCNALRGALPAEIGDTESGRF
jgi:para-aminobenzoate synthetase/4-amino-4-deoxychorismate lyase